MTKNTITALFLLLSFFSQSQTLKLEDIMKGDGYIGEQPFNGRWSLDNKKVFLNGIQKVISGRVLIFGKQECRLRN